MPFMLNGVDVGIRIIMWIVVVDDPSAAFTLELRDETEF
jgi:hypothetical protein